MIEFKNVQKAFKGNRDRSVEILTDCSFCINKGEVVAIVGASGSGKSTILNLIGVLDDADAGYVTLDGQVVPRAASAKATSMRGDKIGFMFQNHRLIPELSCADNVALAARKLIGHHERVNRAIKLLGELGIGEKINSLPSELSGGQQQRVAFCRALANSPNVLLADEPTGNLDEVSTQTLMQVFRDHCSKSQVSAVVVTHNTAILNHFDRIFELRNQKLVEVSVF